MCYAETQVGINTSRQRGRWRQIIAEDHGWSCHWCGQGMRIETGYMNTVTIEHMVPKCQGGTNHRWNLAAACHRCNSLRRHASMDEFEIIALRFEPDDRTIEDVARDNRRARKQRARSRKRTATALILRSRTMMWLQGFIQMLPA